MASNAGHEFLEALRSISALEVTCHEDGFSCTQVFHGDLRELMLRFPQITGGQLRRAAFLIMREQSKEIRAQRYALYYATGRWN